MSDFKQSEERLNELAGVESDNMIALKNRYCPPSSDVLAPFPGCKSMPNPFEMGLASYAKRTLLWSALWSLYFKLDNDRIKELVSSAETTKTGHTYEIGLTTLAPCPLEQLLAMLSMSITDPAELYKDIDKTIGSMIKHEAKREIEVAKQMEQESEFHKTLLNELGVEDLVAHSRERLKSLPNKFERKPLKEYAESIKASIGLYEKSSFDWLQVPIWMQVKVVIAVIDGMAFKTAIYVENKIKKSPMLTYLAKHQPKLIDQKENVIKELGELRSMFQEAHKLAEVKDEIGLAIDMGRIKPFEIENLIRVLGDDA